MCAYSKYPFLPLLASLVTGILCSSLIKIPVLFIYVLCIICVLCFLCQKKISRSYFHFAHAFSGITEFFLLCTVFSIGLTISCHEAIPTSPGINPIRCRCEERLAHNSYIVSSDKCRFYLSSFYTDTIYHPGDSLAFNARLYPLATTSNIGEFDYSRYLHQKNTRYKIIPQTPIRKIGHSRTLRTSFDEIRQLLIQKNAILFQDSLVCHFINALSLGYKDELSEDTRTLFITTGTIHLLAVSGLHTGAVYLLLIYVFRLTGLSKRRSSLLVLPLLWGYACLTGLAPSVIRAATILTFIVSGQILQRDYVPVNAIAASAFFTLLLQPYLLDSVSFLMSYSAYTGIIVLYPFFNRLPGKMSVLPSRIWSCCSVTVSAQLPTLPVSAYYFHTINVNSFLINLLAIPLATIILYSAIVLWFLPVVIGTKIAAAVTLLCRFLFYILQEFSKISLNIENLYPSAGMLLLLYLCFFWCVRYIFTRQLRTLTIAICSTILLLAYCCGYNIWLSHQREIVVFNINKQSAILLNYDGYHSFLQNTNTDPQKTTPYIVKNKLRDLPMHAGLISDQLSTTPHSVKLKNIHIQICHSGNPPTLPADIVIITENTSPGQIFQNKILASYPARIITDGSMDRKHTQIWKKFCDNHNIIFQTTYETGSLTINFND